jgi:hypothetical protein
MDVAMARAKIAVNPAVGLRFPPKGFVQLFCLLEDLQLFHGSSSPTVLYLSISSRSGFQGLETTPISF